MNIKQLILYQNILIYIQQFREITLFCNWKR